MFLEVVSYVLMMHRLRNQSLKYSAPNLSVRVLFGRWRFACLQSRQESMLAPNLCLKARDLRLRYAYCFLQGSCIIYLITSC